MSSGEVRVDGACGFETGDLFVFSLRSEKCSTSLNACQTLTSLMSFERSRFGLHFSPNNLFCCAECKETQSEECDGVRCKHKLTSYHQSQAVG